MRIGHEARETVGLLQNIGLYGLCGYDGCLCGACEVHGVSINIACRKSSGSDYLSEPHTLARITSCSLGVEKNDLEAVAIEVVKQIRNADDWNPIVVRFATYKQDKECQCVYCGKPRETEKGYLCPDCLRKEDAGGRIADRYGFSTLIDRRMEEDRN